MLTETLASTFIKDVLIKSILSASVLVLEFLFTGIDTAILLSLGTLTMFDFATAIAATKNTGEEIKSREAIRTAYKLLIYMVMVSAGVLTEKAMGIDIFITEAMVSFIAITEGISILENIGKMGFDVPNKLLNKLKDLKDTK